MSSVRLCCSSCVTTVFAVQLLWLPLLLVVSAACLATSWSLTDRRGSCGCDVDESAGVSVEEFVLLCPPDVLRPPRLGRGGPVGCCRPSPPWGSFACAPPLMRCTALKHQFQERLWRLPCWCPVSCRWIAFFLRFRRSSCAIATNEELD